MRSTRSLCAWRSSLESWSMSRSSSERTSLSSLVVHGDSSSRTTRTVVDAGALRVRAGVVTGAAFFVDGRVDVVRDAAVAAGAALAAGALRAGAVFVAGVCFTGAALVAVDFVADGDFL